MTASSISDDLWQELQERAKRDGVSPDVLLRRLLHAPEQPTHAMAYLMQVTDHLNKAVAVFDREMRYLLANPAWLTQYGLGDVDVIGASHYEIFPEIGDDWKAIHQRCLQGDADINDRAQFPRADGTLDWIEWQVRPWYEDDAETVIGGLMMITEVITEQVETRNALSDSKRRYQALFEQSTDAIVLADLDSNLIDVNQAFLDLLGYQGMAIDNLNLYPFRAAGEIEKAKALLQRMLQGENIPLYERLLLHRDGTIIPAEIKASLIHDDAGQPLYVQSIVRDIRKRKRTEQQLRDNESLLRTIADHFPRAYISVIERDMTVGFTAGQEFTKHGQDPNQFVGMTVEEVFAPQGSEVVAQVVAHYKRAFAGETVMMELESGNMFHAIHAIPLPDEDGNINRIMALVENITERKLSEAALKASEERYRLLSDVTFEGIVINEMGIIQDVNQAVIDMFGYERDEMVGANGITLFFAPEDQAEIREKVVTQQAAPYEVTAIRKDGTRFPVQIEARQLNENVRVASLRDISERRRMERDLLIKESAMDSSQTPIALADMQGNLTYVNAAFLKLWKLDDVSQALGRSVLDFWVSPEAAQSVVEAIATTATYNGELVALRSDGSQADVQVAASVVTDDDGQPVCMMASFVNVTERKRAEMVTIENERLKVRFQKEQERNALIQRLVSMLSHDLRTPLAVIVSSRDLLERYYDRISDEKRREKLTVIGRQVQFALEILQDTVNVARGNLNEKDFAPQPIKLSTLCRVSIDEVLISEKSQHRIEFINEVGEQMLSVDETLVSRILLNLLGNAIKYSPPEEAITLELRIDGDMIILRVMDRGIGIADNDLPYIFEPFYRTSQTEGISGTGLGLSIVRDCVLRHRGQVHVESQLGEGTTFIVELPLQN